MEDIKVLANRVSTLERDFDEFKEDQLRRWQENSVAHKDLYDRISNVMHTLYERLDRLPAWATLLIAVLSSAATGFAVAFLSRR